jgi:hypothetical protein
MPDFFAHRRTQKEVANISAEWRLAFDIPLDCWAPDLISILQYKLPELFPDFQCVVQEDSYLQGAGAKTTFNPPRIFLARSIWNRAKNDDGFARFTLAHEIGHLILQAARSTFPLIAPTKGTQIGSPVTF